MVKLGFQMSSLTPYLSTVGDMRTTFARVAELGFRDVQLQGIPSEIPDEEIVRALKDSGLNCVATQEDYPLGFGANPERYIARAAACGSQYLTFALIPKEVDTPEKLERFGEKAAQIGEKVKRAGMIFAYHPIGPDFREMEGVPVYRRLLSLLPPETQLTFCVYASFGSSSPYPDVLRDFAGRVDLVHFKDGVKLPGGETQLMPLGEGEHDWKPVVEACHAAGVKWVFAEQERWNRDAFDCMAASYRYLRGIWPKN